MGNLPWLRIHKLILIFLIIFNYLIPKLINIIKIIKNIKIILIYIIARASTIFFNN